MIGERLRRARKAEGLSQRAVADVLGVHREAISRYENMKLLPAAIARFREICLTYGVSLDSMVGLTKCPWCGRSHEQATSEYCDPECERADRDARSAGDP